MKQRLSNIFRNVQVSHACAVCAHHPSAWSQPPVPVTLQVSVPTSNHVDLRTALANLKKTARVQAYRGFTPRQLRQGIRYGTSVSWMAGNSMTPGAEVHRTGKVCCRCCQS
jgi:hypothetical protein